MPKSRHDEDDNVTMLEEEEEEQQESDNNSDKESDKEEEVDKEQPVAKKQKRVKKFVFDAENDETCVAVRTYFEQEEGINKVIVRKTFILAEDDSPIMVGKMAHFLRDCYRSKRQSNLVKARLNALKDLKEFQLFLTKEPTLKQQPNTDAAKLTVKLRGKIHVTQAALLDLEEQIASDNLEIAQREKVLFAGKS